MRNPASNPVSVEGKNIFLLAQSSWKNQIISINEFNLLKDVSGEGEDEAFIEAIYEGRRVSGVEVLDLTG